MSIVTRRSALKSIAVAAATIQIFDPAYLLAEAAGSAALTSEQDLFLEELIKRGSAFFWDQASPRTGQVLDRAAAEGSEKRRIASVAATGFGLTALCIADQQRFHGAAEIRTRVRDTLKFHLEKAPNEHGFFYHFMDQETGARQWKCEVSSIDTALLLCGALTCRAHFRGDGIEREIRALATQLYERVDWPWMLDGGATLSMGWKPESGFIKARWSTYSELMMLYLLGIGSPTHPLDARVWQAFARPFVSYDGFRYISDTAPLFVHQFTHAWFDFRQKHDRYADYFANSITATKAHRAFCLDRGAPYSADYWGVSASDSQQGYTAWGGPPLLGKWDGSVVPCAAAGSLPFLPQECLHVLMNLRSKYPQAWGRYGFVDTFNPGDHWYDKDVLGIDQGISVLMAENLRTGFVWETFARNPELERAMRLCGFTANG